MEITELKKDLAATFRWAVRLTMKKELENNFIACIPDSLDDF